MEIDFISEAGDADGPVSYMPMLSIEWVRKVEESDAITDFPGNSYSMPAEVDICVYILHV